MLADLARFVAGATSSETPLPHSISLAYGYSTLGSNESFDFSLVLQGGEYRGTARISRDLATVSLDFVSLTTVMVRSMIEPMYLEELSDKPFNPGLAPVTDSFPDRNLVFAFSEGELLLHSKSQFQRLPTWAVTHSGRDWYATTSPAFYIAFDAMMDLVAGDVRDNLSRVVDERLSQRFEEWIRLQTGISMSVGNLLRAIQGFAVPAPVAETISTEVPPSESPEGSPDERLDEAIAVLEEALAEFVRLGEKLKSKLPCEERIAAERAAASTAPGSIDNLTSQDIEGSRDRVQEVGYEIELLLAQASTAEMVQRLAAKVEFRLPQAFARLLKVFAEFAAKVPHDAVEREGSERFLSSVSMFRLAVAAKSATLADVRSVTQSTSEDRSQVSRFAIRLAGRGANCLEAWFDAANYVFLAIGHYQWTIERALKNAEAENLEEPVVTPPALLSYTSETLASACGNVQRAAANVLAKVRAREEDTLRYTFASETDEHFYASALASMSASVRELAATIAGLSKSDLLKQIGELRASLRALELLGDLLPRRPHSVTDNIRVANLPVTLDWDAAMHYVGFPIQESIAKLTSSFEAAIERIA